MDRCYGKKKYFDSDNDEQTLLAAKYEAFIEAEPAIIKIASGNSWPSTYDKLKAITIEFVAGWANAAAMPQSIINGIKFLIDEEIIDLPEQENISVDPDEKEKNKFEEIEKVIPIPNFFWIASASGIRIGSWSSDEEIYARHPFL